MTLGAWDIGLYAGALLVLFLTPGPVWVGLIARSLSGGFHAAWPLALGVVVGDVLWSHRTGWPWGCRGSRPAPP